MAGSSEINPVADEVRQILHARSLLKTLDAEVVRTEAKLRRLPAIAAAAGASGGRGVGTGTAAERLAARRGPFKMARNKVDIGLVEIGPKGVGLNVGYLRGMGGKLLTGAIGFHVAAGVGNQVMDLADKQRKLEQQGVSAADRRLQMGADVIGGTAAFLGRATGITPAAGMLLRAGGLTADDVDRRMSDAYDSIFDRTALNLRRRRMEMAARKAADDAIKQYRDANDYLNNWTPDDFDVADDAGRSQLRVEMLQKNRKYVDAFFAAKVGDSAYRAAQDARAD